MISPNHKSLLVLGVLSAIGVVGLALCFLVTSGPWSNSLLDRRVSTTDKAQPLLRRDSIRSAPAFQDSTLDSPDLGELRVEVTTESSGPEHDAAVMVYSGRTPLKDGRTAANGVFSAIVPPGVLLVIARAQNGRQAFKTVRRNPSAPLTSVRIVLALPSDIEGFVQDQHTKRRIPNAAVQVEPDLEASPPDAPRASITTASNGAFRLENIPAGDYRLEVAAVGFVQAKAKFSAPLGGALVLELAAFARIKGVVRRRNGEGAAAVLVGASCNSGRVETQSHTDGAFELVVEPGSYMISATTGNEAALAGPIDVPPGSMTDGVELLLGPARRLFGILQDSQTKTGIPGVVRVEPNRRDGVAGQTTASAAGEYEIADLVPGIYDIVAASPGYSDSRKDGLVIGQSDFELNLALRKGGQLRGEVQDTSGRGIPGVRIAAGSGATPLSTLPSTETVQDGTFHLDSVPSGLVYVYATKSGEFGPAMKNAVVEPLQTSVVNFVIETARTPITVRVSRRNGSVPRSLTTLDVLQLDPVSSFKRVAISNAKQGLFVLALSKGKYRLRVETAEGAGTSELNVDEQAQEAHIEFMDKNLNIIVLSPEGSPVPNARVIIRDTLAVEAPSLSEPTDQEGRATFAIPDHGEGLLVQANSRWRTGQTYVQSGQSELTLRLQPAASLEGTVRVARNSSLPAYSVRLPEWGDGISPVPILSFNTTDFSLPEAPFGKYVVKVMADDGRTGQTEVDLQPGARGHVDVLLGEQGRVHFRVLDKLSRAAVPVPFVELDGTFTDTLPIEGICRLENVAAGAHVMRVSSRTHSVTTLKFETRSESDLDLGTVLVSSTSGGEVGIDCGLTRLGLTVTGLRQGSPAQKAGVKTEDLLLSADSYPVATKEDCVRRLPGPPGSILNLKVGRQGVELSFAIQREQ